jgi:raffinose/stachyose/melibiose transport system substrate-binding protein
MWLAGSWNSGPIISALGEDAVGMFLLPSAAGAEVPYTIGGIGLGYGIRATSENADMAAEYIDLMTSAAAGQLLFANGYLPAVAIDDSALEEGALTSDMVRAWNTISRGNAVGHYLDWTLPDAGARIQELLAGVATPEQFVANMEADYTAEQ